MKNKLPVAKPSKGAEVCAPSKPSKDDEARMRRYRAEDALRTMNQAADFQKDKSLMKDVKALAEEQMASLKKFTK